MRVLGGVRDWWVRRGALRELKKRQRDDETILASQVANPFEFAKQALKSGDRQELARMWEQAKKQLPLLVVESEESLWILIALERFDEAEALMRDRHRQSRGDRFYLIGLAHIAERRGDFAGAVQRWKAAREAVPDDFRSWFHGARCLIALDRLDEAESLLEDVIRFDPENVEAMSECARIREMRRDWRESARRWKDLADRFTFAPGCAGYGRALAELGRVDEAGDYLEQAARNYPLSLDIVVARAHLAVRVGDLTAVSECWQVARGLAPFFVPGYREGAHWLLKGARADEAEAVLLDAIGRFPDEAWPRLDYARIAHERGDWHEAAARWADLRRMFPAEDAGFLYGTEALKADGRDGEAEALRPRT